VSREAVAGRPYRIRGGGVAVALEWRPDTARRGALGRVAGGAGVLLPPLLRKYSAVQDTDRSLLPLLECISSIVSAIGPGFSPYVPEVSPRP
jgi:hypothetical protein